MIPFRLMLEYALRQGVREEPLPREDRVIQALTLKTGVSRREWGGRRDLNPRQPDPQSGALTGLSYGHHTGQHTSFRARESQACARTKGTDHRAQRREQGTLSPSPGRRTMSGLYVE
jgi:hypothetical protein